MNKRDVFKKTVAWAMIVATINPAMIAPAFSRDSDIYLATTSGNATAEPNVLFILGTNDRMNVAEAWREYPGAYDSHAEYLWNDINVISTSEVTTEEANAISDASPPVNPFSPWVHGQARLRAIVKRYGKPLRLTHKQRKREILVRAAPTEIIGAVIGTTGCRQELPHRIHVCGRSRSTGSSVSCRESPVRAVG